MLWETQFLRKIAWSELEALQQDCLARVRRDPTQSFLLISEPTPTFTRGISAKNEDLLWGPEEQRHAEAEVKTVTRGGKWTFHGPGQIVAYPILDLASHGFARRAVYHYLGQLRASTLELLSELRVPAEASERPFGIYVNKRKLVSFGIGVSRGVTSYGMALYYEPQARYFAGINPCGVHNEAVHSLRELGVDQSWENVAQRLSECIKKGFKRPQM